MKIKLTIEIRADVAEKAKDYAMQTGISLSNLIENHLHSITNEDNKSNQLSQKIKQIAGVVKLPTDFDDKKELDSYFMNKHL